MIEDLLPLRRQELVGGRTRSGHDGNQLTRHDSRAADS